MNFEAVRQDSGQVMCFHSPSQPIMIDGSRGAGDEEMREKENLIAGRKLWQRRKYYATS